MVKKLSLLVVFLFFAGCATTHSAKGVKNKATSTPPSASSSTESSGAATAVTDVDVSASPVQEDGSELSAENPAEPVEDSNLLAPQPVPRPVPRIGLIFSAGGVRTWADIGVLREIEKAKWPVQAVAGLEWGAAVAAVYAEHLSSNEVEWELSKVKSLSEVADSSRVIFGRLSVADLKVPFVCPSLNIDRQLMFLLNRGQLTKLMPFCLAHPPVSDVYSKSVASLSDIEALAQHLRATGVNKVVLVNVLSQKTKRAFVEDSALNIIWSAAAARMSGPLAGVDDVIQINLDGVSITDFASRREAIAKGAELGYSEVRRISDKYGL
jgi:NTE family protein